MTIRVDISIRRKAIDDPRKNDDALSLDLRCLNIAEINRLTVSIYLRDAGLYGKVGVKKL